MKKKFFVVLLAMALTSSFMLGCGSTQGKENVNVKEKETEEDQNIAAAGKKEEATGEIGGSLVIWEHTDQFSEPLKKVVAGFNEQYPGVTVEIEIKTSDQYYNLLQTAMQAGETPDLFWTNGLATTQYESYINAGYCMELTDKIDFSLYDGTAAMKIVTAEDEKIYATPTAELGGRCVYYNKDIFDELGLEVPKTFSDFEALLDQISKTDYTPIAFTAADPWAILFQFEPVLNAMHLDYVQEYENSGDVAVNDKRVVEAYEKMLEWAENGYYGKGYLGVDESGALLAFSKGEAAMCVEGTWNIATIDGNNPELNYGAFQIPTEDGVQSIVGTSSCGYSVSAKTENPEAALAFENYFASLEGQKIWISALSAIPCTTQIVSENPVVNDIAAYDVQTESYYSILGYLTAPNTEETPTNVWEEDQTKIFSGSLGVQEFVDELEALTK
ncbi:MAG: extracellular solute-binding protein [Lachnospiraceae bacterium]